MRNWEWAKKPMKIAQFQFPYYSSSQASNNNVLIRMKMRSTYESNKNQDSMFTNWQQSFATNRTAEEVEREQTEHLPCLRPQLTRHTKRFRQHNEQHIDEIRKRERENGKGKKKSSEIHNNSSFHWLLCSLHSLKTWVMNYFVTEKYIYKVGRQIKIVICVLGNRAMPIERHSARV